MSATPDSSLADSTYLGPATVLPNRDSGMWVGLEDGSSAEVSVELAFTFPYAPLEGDRLLVIGRDGQHFAIGVLAGSGRPTLAFQGDVDLHAVGGSLNLRGGSGVRVEAPEIVLRAETLRTFSHSMTETADTAYRWVKGLLTVRAGESQRAVQGEDYSQCKRSVTLAEETVKIDGHQLQLGH
jgi:hypothetical protein